MKELIRLSVESPGEFTQRIKNFTDDGWILINLTDYSASLEKPESRPNVAEFCGVERPPRKVFCQLPKGHSGSHRALIFWEDNPENSCVEKVKDAKT